MRSAAACAALLSVVVCSAPAQPSKYGNGEVTIGRYAVTDLRPERDTVAPADSAHLVLSLALDCTNRITRFEAVADTSRGRRRMVVSVFGTFIHGRRPMCPVRIVKRNFAVKFSVPGVWEVAAAGPDGKPLRAPRCTVVVGRSARGHSRR